MSRAIAVFHGLFGRATIYQLNRPFKIHAHREGGFSPQSGLTRFFAAKVGIESTECRRAAHVL
jgi:hypothetical protein